MGMYHFELESLTGRRSQVITHACEIVHGPTMPREDVGMFDVQRQLDSPIKEERGATTYYRSPHDSGSLYANFTRHLGPHYL